MKVVITIDCTPDEARQFFGLPNVKPMQESVMSKLEKQMLDAVAAMSPEALLRMWAPFMPQTPEQFRDAMANLFRSTFGGASGGRP